MNRLGDSFFIVYTRCLQKAGKPKQQAPKNKLSFSSSRHVWRAAKITFNGSQGGVFIQRRCAEAQKTHADDLYTVMIQPQVHLRLPCYDFYFL